MYKQYPNMLRILTILPLRILSFFFTVEDPHPEEFLLPYPPRDAGAWGGTKMVRTRDFNLWKVRMFKIQVWLRSNWNAALSEIAVAAKEHLTSMLWPLQPGPHRRQTGDHQCFSGCDRWIFGII